MFYVECKPDGILVGLIAALPKRQVIHEIKGKYEIAKRLSEAQGAKGLLDQDPNSIQPAYLSRLNLEQDLPQSGLKVLHDSTRDNYVILLCPRLEEWIALAAREAESIVIDDAIDRARLGVNHAASLQQ